MNTTYRLRIGDVFERVVRCLSSHSKITDEVTPRKVVRILDYDKAEGGHGYCATLGVSEDSIMLIRLFPSAACLRGSPRQLTHKTFHVLPNREPL